MPDTFFTQAPHWEWLIVLYFFIGGLAGGSYFIAALLNLYGRPEDRPIVRRGYYVAVPAIVLSGLLLAIDLTRPLRFWHMLIQSKTWSPAFKYWSPISVGSWVITLFGFFAFLSLVGVLAEIGRLPWRSLTALSTGRLGAAINLIGGFLGFFVASYTGVLLATTNRPLWADTWFLGLLFLISGVSTSAALLVLLGWRSSPGTLHWLSQFDDWTLLAELVVLLIVVLSVGTTVVREVLLNGWGVLLVIGVVLIGILVPLVIHRVPGLLGGRSLPSAAALVLIGGFILRLVIVMSSERV
jgi:formate-dependent nitrite reductase membrane component NrfD